MSPISLEFEPLEIATRDVDVVRNCMARLSIHVDGECVTAVLDKRAKTTRDSLTTSLYPLAEWMAANWWFLFHEPWTPGRETVNRTFDQRHSTRFAGDGFAWPDLQIIPEGEFVRLQWKPRKTTHQNVMFLGEHRALLRRSEVESALGGFIDQVLGRLEATGIATSWLHEEWSAIQDALSDVDQSAACERTAALGVDPFNLNDATAAQLDHAASALDESLQNDFFNAVDVRSLPESLDWINETRRLGSDSCQIEPSFWKALRADFAPLRSTLSETEEPWQRGYNAAVRCRQLLGSESEVSVDKKLGGLRLPIVAASPPPIPSFDALLCPTVSMDAPVCATARRSGPLKRFAFCRGLYDYLCDARPTPRLLTASQTSRQQSGRAFAAEFLAPSWLLRSRIGDEVGADEISELAMEFDVTEQVIRHQIENHRLGRLTG